MNMNWSCSVVKHILGSGCVLAILAGFCATTPGWAAPLETLSKCDDFGSHYRERVNSEIERGIVGQIQVSFTSYPSFQSESGIRVIQVGDKYILRSVTIKKSIWYGAYEETKPGTFQQNFEKPPYDRELGEIPLDPELAIMLRSRIVKEVGNASDDRPMGLDGESYEFSHGGTSCASTWSPDGGTRPQKLVSLFDDLEILTRLPSILARPFWEMRIRAKLYELSEENMPLNEYIRLAEIWFGIILAACFPFVFSAIVSIIPKRPPKKRLFVLASGLASYGVTCLVAILFSPIFVVGAWFAEILKDDGHVTLGSALRLANDHYLISLILFLFMTSILLPICARGRLWRAAIERIHRGSSAIETVTQA